jgi:hypothetical protein
MELALSQLHTPKLQFCPLLRGRGAAAGVEPRAKRPGWQQPGRLALGYSQFPQSPWRFFGVKLIGLSFKFISTNFEGFFNEPHSIL